MPEQNVQILDQLTAVNLNVAIWTARKKLTADDFGGVELPPEELASLGSKKICDPDSLKIFSTLKARAVNHLGKVGIRFLGGWAIPDDLTQAVHEKLEEIKSDFMAAKDSFLNNYDLAVNGWISKHPGWERLIESSAVSVDQVRRRLGFSWQFYKVVPPEQSLIGDSLQNEVDNLGSTLFGEISKDAQGIWNKVYAGKTEVSHKALSPIKAMRQKLMDLSFVESMVVPVISVIDEAIASVPKRGLIRGQHLLVLQGLVSVLRDPVSLRELGEKVLSGQQPLAILSGLNAKPHFFSGQGSNLDQADLEDTEIDFDPTDEDDSDDFEEPSEEPLLEGIGDEIEIEDSSNNVQPDQERTKRKGKSKRPRNVPCPDSFGLW
jgi:hypothetical protein